MMLPSEKRIPASLKMVVGLLALLTLVAVLQYDWLGQVSRAEQERMRNTLRSAVDRFAEDFDRETARAFVYFFRATSTAPGVSPESRLAERFRLWREEAPHPDLVEDLFLAQPDEQGRLQWMQLDTAMEFQPVDEAPVSGLSRRLRNPFGGRAREPMPFFVIEEIPALPALVIPMVSRPDSPGPDPRRGRSRDATRPPVALVVATLDLPFIQEELLPLLATRYFDRGGELDFELVVFRNGDPEAVVFQSDPESRFVTGDAATSLLGPLRFEGLRHLWVETGLGLEESRRFQGGRPGSPPGGRAGNETGLWQLVVRHRAGSLEAAVGAARLRNLAISLGILALLAVSMVMILLSTQRAQQLARQQMEFVAGVTHELQTPLAVIRSAGQNLADGVVDVSGQVKEYGSLIEKEGRRLSGMVDQVLEFAGLQSRGRPPERVPLAIDEIIETALADCEPAISEGEIQVEKSIEPDLPRFMGDPSALRRALHNLLDNAIKYGGDGKWIGVGARRSKDAIDVTVEDRGPGIAPVDLPNVFEPFYRGRRGRHPQSRKEARGNGLGLSLVQQIIKNHGGRVGVRSSAADGTVFTIHLPTE